MWLSEKTAWTDHGGARARMGGVTIGGENAAVMLSGEHRGLRVLTPAGMLWRPGAGTDVLVLETDDGERFILGTADGGGEFPTLAEGELCLKNGDCRLLLGADGGVHINGDVYVTGRLILNGAEVTVGG